jgi:hypothetical protein
MAPSRLGDAQHRLYAVSLSLPLPLPLSVSLSLSLTPTLPLTPPQGTGRLNEKTREPKPAGLSVLAA